MKIPSLIVPVFLASVVLLSTASPNPLPDDPSCSTEERVFIEKANFVAVEKGNSPFGAVRVINGKVVAEYGNNVAGSHDPTRHAEK